MRIYVVTANVMDRDEYRDYTLKPVDRWHPYFTMRKRLADQYGEYVSIMAGLQDCIQKNRNRLP